MKKNLLLSLALVAFTFLSCEEDIDKVTFLGGSTLTLSASSTTDLVLEKSKEAYNSLQFQWTSPNYQFSNGVNTQDVKYTLQIDKEGNNFSNAKLVNLDFPNSLTASFKVKDLNSALAGLELPDNVLNTFEFRVRAALQNNTAPVYSNTVKIKIATYLDVVFPVPAELYITGAATPVGWMSGGDQPVTTQKFTKVNSYLFEITNLQIKSSSPFLFVPVYGNWDNKYGFTGEKEKNNPAEDSFKPGGEDLLSPSTARAYKITVNFKTGKFKFE